MSELQPLYTASHALLVGIDSYHDPRFVPLGQAEVDARAAAEVLSAPPYRFNVRLLLGDEATKQAIQRALFELRRTGPDDRVLVYFAGHGYSLTNRFGGETGYLAAADTIPDQDFTALELSEVTNLRLHAGAKHIAFVFDACFSGQALGLTRAPISAADKFLQRRAYQVISAGAGDQTVADFHSMTDSMLSALGSELLDGGPITVSRLGLYLQQTMAADSGHTQIPQFGHLQGSQGGEFVFDPGITRPVTDGLGGAIGSASWQVRLGAVEALIEMEQSGHPEQTAFALEWLSRMAMDEHSRVQQAARAFLEGRAGKPIPEPAPSPSPADQPTPVMALPPVEGEDDFTPLMPLDPVVAAPIDMPGDEPTPLMPREPIAIPGSEATPLGVHARPTRPVPIAPQPQEDAAAAQPREEPPAARPAARSADLPWPEILLVTGGWMVGWVSAVGLGLALTNRAENVAFQQSFYWGFGQTFGLLTGAGLAGSMIGLALYTARLIRSMASAALVGAGWVGAMLVGHLAYIGVMRLGGESVWLSLLAGSGSAAAYLFTTLVELATQWAITGALGGAVVGYALAQRRPSIRPMPFALRWLGAVLVGALIGLGLSGMGGWFVGTLTGGAVIGGLGSLLTFRRRLAESGSQPR